jgi:hypothetical protein
MTSTSTSCQEPCWHAAAAVCGNGERRRRVASTILSTIACRCLWSMAATVIDNGVSILPSFFLVHSVILVYVLHVTHASCYLQLAGVLGMGSMQTRRTRGASGGWGVSTIGIDHGMPPSRCLTTAATSLLPALLRAAKMRAMVSAECQQSATRCSSLNWSTAAIMLFLEAMVPWHC